MAHKTRSELRKARHTRIRKHLTGTAERPRLAVFRSLKHIYAQVIDDEKGHTVAAASSAASPTAYYKTRALPVVSARA